MVRFPNPQQTSQTVEHVVAMDDQPPFLHASREEGQLTFQTQNSAIAPLSYDFQEPVVWDGEWGGMKNGHPYYYKATGNLDQYRDEDALYVWDEQNGFVNRAPELGILNEGLTTSVAMSAPLASTGQPLILTGQAASEYEPDNGNHLYVPFQRQMGDFVFIDVSDRPGFEALKVAEDTIDVVFKDGFDVVQMPYEGAIRFMRMEAPEMITLCGEEE